MVTREKLMPYLSLPHIWSYIYSMLPTKWIHNGHWMNERAKPNRAYIPTPIEHVANVVTHGVWVVPSVMASLKLVQNSNSWQQLISAWIYGAALMLLFFVSTWFHSVHYCNRNLNLKDFLHRSDRAMIYIFIAASYFPWLNLASISPGSWACELRWLIWLLAFFGIVYQQIFHERYKSLETCFYLVMGIGPSIVILTQDIEITGMTELKIGGLIYVIGVFFFKSDVSNV